MMYRNLEKFASANQYNIRLRFIRKVTTKVKTWEQDGTFYISWEC